VESHQLSEALGVPVENVDVPELLVTLGPKGAIWRSNKAGNDCQILSPKVQAVDTTAAGDTFIGYVAAGLDLGQNIEDAMTWAASAAALKVTRSGAATAIPTAADVAEFSSLRK